MKEEVYSLEVHYFIIFSQHLVLTNVDEVFKIEELLVLTNAYNRSVKGSLLKRSMMLR